MSIGKLFLGVIVLGGAAAGVLYATGMLTYGDDGVKLNTERIAEAVTPSEYTKAEIAFGQGSWGEAIGLYKEALAAHPDSPNSDEATYRIAVSYEKMGTLSQALAAYKDYLLTNPSGRYVSQAKKQIEFLDGTGVR